MLTHRPTAPRAGDAWYSPRMVHGLFAPYFLESVLSIEYRRDWRRIRPPIFLCVPGDSRVCIDAAFRGGSAWAEVDGHGWSVSGLPPHLTATPLIATPTWAGYLFDGTLGDDVLGRTYPEDD